MRHIVTTKWLDNLSKNEIIATLKSVESVGELIFSKCNEWRIRNPKTVKVFLLKRGGRYVGWSICDISGHFYGYSNNRVDIYVNVRPQYRRKGYGSKLYLLAYNFAKKNWPNRKVTVQGWDKQSTKFYKHQRKENKVKLRIENNS